ncbi:hypothetical protein [Streptomyces murinus]|uniref:hypothetical protein n=1 Tax=Streptomyces murinus TaxID=33900 RepID=UPI0018F5EF24|nr:hypothetical protein [Streptomyces murinus]
MSTTTPPKSPTVAIARVLRSLDLAQGRGGDFRITGEYRNGERIGTYVLPLTRHADETVAAHADEIERLAAETGFPFRVSVRYPSGDRPMTSVANYGDRVRDVAPAPAAEAAPEPAEPSVTPVPELPPAGSTASRFLEGARERAWQSQQVRALGWSAGQADLMTAAGSAQLLFDRDGVLRHYPRPGWAGHAIADGRLDPLVKAGFLVVTEPYGPGSKRVSTTVDGRDALLLWRRWRPAPVVKDRKEDRAPLRPLLGGEEATRRGAAFAEDQRKREAERAALYAAFEELHAWEERDERLWKVWARVQGITYRLGRQRPAGWVPTPEEIAEHHLDPAAVAELRAEAGCPVSKPELPKSSPLRPVELPPLPAAPDEVEQLGLFGDVA